MKIPKEIREKIEQRINLDKEIHEWFEEHVSDMDSYDFQNACIVDEPQGVKTRDGEYCDQRIRGEDWFSGEYYWEMDNGKYLCVNYEMY